MMAAWTSCGRREVAVEQLDARGEVWGGLAAGEWIVERGENGGWWRAGWAGICGLAVVALGVWVIVYYLALHSMSLIFNELCDFMVFDRGLHRIYGEGLSGCVDQGWVSGMGGEGVRAAGWLVPYNTFGREEFIGIALGVRTQAVKVPRVVCLQGKKKKRVLASRGDAAPKWIADFPSFGTGRWRPRILGLTQQQHTPHR